MSELNRLEYIIEETIRVAADYNFYWNVGNIKGGIKITFTTTNCFWSNTVTITNMDINYLGEEIWKKAITDLIETNAEAVDTAEADYFVKNFDRLFGGKE